MVRTTERHDRRRHREGQTQTWTIKNTKVGFPESLAAVDVGIIESGVDIVVLGVAIGVLVLNAFLLSVDVSVLVYKRILAVDIAVLRRQ